MDIKVIDLFAGCGGLSDGFFKTNNFDMVCVVDWNKKCCETQIHNMIHKRLRYRIVIKVEGKELIRTFRNSPDPVVIKFEAKGPIIRQIKLLRNGLNQVVIEIEFP